MENKCIKFLSGADFLSDDLNFTYKNRSKLKTIFGGVTSVLILILNILLFGYFSIDLVERRKPISRLSQEVKDYSNISILDFPIAFGYHTASDTQIEDIDSLITAYVSLRKFEKGNGTTIVTRYKGSLEKCDLNINFQKYKDLFNPKDFDYKTTVCIHPNKSFVSAGSGAEYFNETYFNRFETLSFYNEFSSVPSAFININIVKCNEKRDRKKCLSDDIYKSRLNDFYLRLYTVDYYVDLQDFKNPNKPKIFSNDQQLTSAMAKRSYFKYKKIWINTDDGLLFENINTIDFHQLYTTKLDNYFTDGVIYTMSFEVASANDIFYRRYDKLVDILAKIGGFFKLMYILGQILNVYYSKSKFYFEVTNKLFEKEITYDKNEKATIFHYNNNNNNLFDKEISNDKTIQRAMLPIKNINNVNISNSPMINYSRCALTNNFVLLKKEIKKELDLNFGDYLKASLCRQRANFSRDLYSLSQEIIKNKLDIMTYFNKMESTDQVMSKIAHYEEAKINLANAKYVKKKNTENSLSNNPDKKSDNFTSQIGV